MSSSYILCLQTELDTYHLRQGLPLLNDAGENMKLEKHGIIHNFVAFVGPVVKLGRLQVITDRIEEIDSIKAPFNITITLFSWPISMYFSGLYQILHELQHLSASKL